MAFSNKKNRKQNHKDKIKTKKRGGKRRGTRKIKGGFSFFGDSSNVSAPLVKEDTGTACSSSETCNFMDNHITGKPNELWTTCIDMNDIKNQITYVTPKNVIIKSIETGQIPEFVAKIVPKSVEPSTQSSIETVTQTAGQSNEPISCKIMIEDKYVNCFLFICGDWYAMMRLFGTTLNTGYFARTEKNRVFYKLNRGMLTDLENSGLLEFKENEIENVESSGTMFSTSTTKVIKIKDEFVKNINKQSVVNNKVVFNVLQRFRQQKLFAHNVKEEVAKDVAEEGAKGIWSFFS